MKEIFWQVNQFGNNVDPHSQEDVDALKTFKPNQILRAQCYGTEKARSLKQLATFWCACRTVAGNSEDPQWDNKDKVAMQCKIKTNFIDLNRSVVVGDTFYPHFRSIAFRNLKHMEACGFFNMSFEIMAKHIETTVEKLLENANKGET